MVTPNLPEQYMDDRNLKLAEGIVNPSYLRLGQNSINKRDKIMKQILSQRQLPNEPLDELTLRYFLDSLAMMDSNNFDQKSGVGERQSRIFSQMVANRHFSMGHGIGRSGDVMANQPKAAGSSLLLQITRFLTVSALHELNYDFVEDVLLLPLATGMSLSLALLTLAQSRPDRPYVVWSRIDQKTCLKAIITANLKPVVVQLRRVEDSLVSDLVAIEAAIQYVGADKILAIVSTTSCFAPRVPDNVDQTSLLAKKYKLYHVVNNAYGIWCSKIANSIKEGMRRGECTVVVQSTDKNFMVPVGGSFVFSSDQTMLAKISAKYPGRASGSPIVDMFITMLSMGKATLLALKKERKINYEFMRETALEFAKSYGLAVLSTPANTISIAMSVAALGVPDDEITRLGSILYSKRVMGHRIIARSDKITNICGNQFANYGSHSQNYPKMPYITFACAVGTKHKEIQLFFGRMRDSFKELTKQKSLAGKCDKKETEICSQGVSACLEEESICLKDLNKGTECHCFEENP